MDIREERELVRLRSRPVPVVESYPLFFFFQAEDGIRDKLVTGVQTCALPIWNQRSVGADRERVSLFFKKRSGGGLAGDSHRDFHKDALTPAAVGGEPGGFAEVGRGVWRGRG